jgi:hypothetical protein
MVAAEDHSQPYALRDADRRYFRSPGQRRLLFWRGDSFLMEFRSQWLARYIAVGPSGRARWRQERWDHPLSAWLLPLELIRCPDWRSMSSEEFEQVWAALGEARHVEPGAVAERPRD